MDDLAYWLALNRCPGIGPILFQAILEHVETPRNAFDKPAALGAIPRLPKKAIAWLESPAWDTIELDMEWSTQPNNHILTQASDKYPPLLKELSDAPPILYVHGDVEILTQPQLAMVGSRNPTAGGKEIAASFAKHLANKGFTITSGLATGIDTAAHQGALNTLGNTIAVMGTGIDRVYPAKNQSLAHQIVDNGGALLSEFPLATVAGRENFPRRNRIISGLSLGTLVVEAAKRSGSLITARLASEQGREVFAIPGSIHNPLARGCHALIRQGAKLVETADDILEELGQFVTFEASSQSNNLENATYKALDPEYESVLRCLGFEPTSVDVVVDRSSLPAETVSSILLVLELQDYVEAHTGGYYSRRQ